MRKTLLLVSLLSTSLARAQVDSLLKRFIQEKVDALINEQTQENSYRISFYRSRLLSDSKNYNIRINEKSKTSWKNSGIKYRKGQGANLGVSSFCIIDVNTI